MDVARARLATWSRRLGVGALLLAIGLALVVSPLPDPVRYGPLVLGSLAIGLPHGAVDWAALPLARQGRLAGRDLAIVGVLYAVLGGLVVAAWWIAPVPAAVGFVLLTWLHWGQGDRHTLERLYGAGHALDRLQRALTISVRGGIPMVVPLLAFPDTYRRVLDLFVAPFGGTAVVPWLLADATRLAIGGALLLATLLALGRGLARRGPTGGWVTDLIETITLWATFLLVPPVFAIGVYFAAWHSWRHVARVLLLDEPSTTAIAGGRWGRPALRFGVAAAVPTVASLALLGALWAVVPAPPTTIQGLTGLGLVAIAALTLPHVAIVTWLDLLEAGTRHG